MPKQLSLVIDTSVARASGSADTIAPLGQQCRKFLVDVLIICHHIAFSLELKDEWKTHASRYSRAWLVQMYARKKVDRLPSASDQQIEADVSNCGASENQKREMKKDLHLAIAAAISDKIVVSLETNSPTIYAKHLPVLQKRFGHTWIVLNQDPNKLTAWLENGGRIPQEIQFSVPAGDS